MAMQFKNVLFPTDFSALSVHALTHAASLVETFESQLHCIYVVDDANFYWTAFGPEAVPLGPPVDELVTQARLRMERFAGEHLRAFQPPPVTDVRVGRPFAEIIAYAREKQVDLIVMGTHGRGAIAHALLGSTTEKVVRKAPCAVLTVRSPDHQFSPP